MIAHSMPLGPCGQNSVVADTESNFRHHVPSKFGFIFGGGGSFWFWILIYLAILAIAVAELNPVSFAAALPGTDASDKLEAAGTLLRLLDTALFKWGARIFAGLCVMSAGWSLKEQRFGIAIICIVAALIFGTSTTWVKNVFSISSGDSVFSS